MVATCGSAVAWANHFVLHLQSRRPTGLQPVLAWLVVTDRQSRAPSASLRFLQPETV